MIAATSAAFPSAAVGWLLLLSAAGWTLYTARAADVATPKKPDWKWWLLVGAILLVFRWPLFWVPHQLNPDESQLIAGGLTLTHDPVFWRSVDGGTAGPLDYYPLLAVAWGDGPASYAIARLIALIVVLGTFVFAGETLAFVAGTAVARLAVLPAVAFYALTSNPDFIHYSTELMPAWLIAIAGWAAVRQTRIPSRRWLWLIAVALGGVPWAKLQAIPLALTLGMLVAIHEIRHNRPRSLVVLAAGSLMPATACFAMVTLTGQAEHLVTPFFFQNFAYIGAPQFSWPRVAALQWQNALIDGYFGLWLAGAVIAGALAFAWGIRGASTARRRMVTVAALLLAAGVLSALGPRRPSTHHLHLLVLPLIWMMGAFLAFVSEAGTPRNQRLLAAGVFVGCCVVPQLVWRLLAPNPFADFNALGVTAERRELSRVVRELAAPGEPIAIWGWRCSLYVEAGRHQATRQAQTEAQIYESPLRPYFLQRYLQDFQTSNPPVFADAVGPGAFAFDSPRVAHEVFSALRELIQNRYTLVATLDGTRLYARNDRVPNFTKNASPVVPTP